MTKRNIKVYLKDKTAIIFSMMTQIIILGLYLLFLKQNYVDSMTSMLDGFNIKTEDNFKSSVNSGKLEPDMHENAMPAVSKIALITIVFTTAPEK